MRKEQSFLSPFLTLPKIPDNSSEVECLRVLSSLARLASSASPSQADTGVDRQKIAEECQNLLGNGVQGHSSPLFKTLALQLAVWTTADPQMLQESIIFSTSAGLSDQLLGPHEQCLMHLQIEGQSHAQLPWTSAYTIFHAALLTRSAIGLRATQHGQKDVASEATLKAALQSVPGQLGMFCRMFRGLQDLAVLYDQIISPETSNVNVRG